MSTQTESKTQDERKALKTLGYSLLGMVAFGALFLVDQIVTPVSSDPEINRKALYLVIATFAVPVGFLLLENAGTLLRTARRLITR